jgi:hypothetical protein
MVVEQSVQEKLEKHREERADKKVQESKTFTKEELDRISSIKANYDALTLRMGQIHFESKAINTEREQVEEAFQKNRDDEVKFAQELTTKYGKGSLDIDTGIFTPSE